MLNTFPDLLFFCMQKVFFSCRIIQTCGSPLMPEVIQFKTSFTCLFCIVPLPVGRHRVHCEVVAVMLQVRLCFARVWGSRFVCKLGIAIILLQQGFFWTKKPIVILGASVQAMLVCSLLDSRHLMHLMEHRNVGFCFVGGGHNKVPWNEGLSGLQQQSPVS